MVLSLIKSDPDYKKESIDDGSTTLRVSEMFGNTIQGEGPSAGVPATFLRLQGCTLSCTWCDTLDVWKYGNKYTIDDIINMWDYTGLVESFKNGQHLILTGGSPLKQQDALESLLKRFKERYGFLPYIEVENECTLMPSQYMMHTVNQWNLSPKLSNSGMSKKARYKPDVLTYFNQHASANSSFVNWKFVVSNEDEWTEIVEDFVEALNINRKNIFIMPEGQTREELQKKYDFIVELACRENVRVSDRTHVSFWDKKTGV